MRRVRTSSATEPVDASDAASQDEESSALTLSAEPPSALKADVEDPYYARIVTERDKTFEALQMFIDWRHKVMVRFMVLAAAALGAWHYLPEPRWQLQAVALVAGAISSELMVQMDRVNAGHLSRLYERGAALEREILTGVGIFGAIRNEPQDALRITWITAGSQSALKVAREPRTSSYTKLIELMYRATAGAFAIGAVATVSQHLSA